MKKIAVLGAGSWGTALSIVLADNDYDVRLWSHREDQVNEINETNRNARYLDVDLPASIKAYAEIKEAVQGVEAVLIVVPSSAMREVMKKLRPYIAKDTLLIHASKGVEPDTLKRISEVILEEVPSYEKERIVVLSGPSHAEEVAFRLPTTVTVAAENIVYAQQAQNIFMNDDFRVYTSTDVIGVELGGALKNIIALGAGILDGLQFGDNAKAALITRGLAEITRLATAMGANPLTFLGLCGVGDLIVTSTSTHSRNWRAGNLLGQGKKLDDILKEMNMVVEGVRTTKAAYQLSKRYDVEMPITEGLYAVLFKEKDPEAVVQQLMNREKRKELDNLKTM
ncbi:MAG TPA: NAD(P)H-dependent glycerol-3-phosphate dehydrogenase [Pseudogracilibacillus sp.]|nr:NAD(P)H-dependent glycerol-3-phosphate dehydrogenase [Pseudogracilibacillus sp.]